MEGLPRQACIPEKCPFCGGAIGITHIKCEDCGSETVGVFNRGGVWLSDENVKLLAAFLKYRGNLEKVAGELGVSQITASGILAAVSATLGIEHVDAVPDTCEIVPQGTPEIGRMANRQLDPMSMAMLGFSEETPEIGCDANAEHLQGDSPDSGLPTGSDRLLSGPKCYAKEIDESPLLTFEEEQELARKIIADNDPEARTRLVRSNLRLVVNIAKRYAGRGVELDDLIEEGNVGLLRSVDCFDPDYGVRFSTYAAWWIKQSIRRAITAEMGPVTIPAYMVDLVNQFRRVYRELEARLARGPSLKEISEAMGLPHVKVKAISEVVDTLKHPPSQYSDYHADSHDELADQEDVDDGFLENVQDLRVVSAEDVMLTDEEKVKLKAQLGRMDPQEAKVLALRFGLDGNEPLTLKQIGKVLGLNRERIRQIQRTALEQLNEKMTEA